VGAETVMTNREVDRGAASVRAFRPDDEGRVLAILQLAFGAWPDAIAASPAQFFDWKHRTGPFGESVLLVVELDGEVAGFAGYMPWRLRARQRTLTATRGVDYAVHPDYRRRGATDALRAFADELPGVRLIWSNPNEPTRRGGVKFGRHVAGTVPRYARPSRRLASTLARTRARNWSPREQPAIEASSAAELLGDGEFVARVLSGSLDPPGRWVTDKSLEFLRWRYGQFEDYRGVRCESRREGRGFAIFRPRRFGRFWVLDVCELLATQNRRDVARALIARVARSSDGDFVSCGFLSHHEAAALGFVQASRGSNLLANPLERGIVPDPARIDSWALSRGDLELL
jgi:GNAT acetyltransferase-like protein